MIAHPLRRRRPFLVIVIALWFSTCESFLFVTPNQGFPPFAKVVLTMEWKDFIARAVFYLLQNPGVTLCAKKATFFNISSHCAFLYPKINSPNKTMGTARGFFCWILWLEWDECLQCSLLLTLFINLGQEDRPAQEEVNLEFTRWDPCMCVCDLYV